MLKTNTRLSGCFTAGLAGLMLLNAAALAGSLDAPAAPIAAGSAMYTLQDLCNRLNTGAAGTLRTGPFAEPSAGPAATMCTLNEIMAAMPTVDANGAGVADVLAGKTFWGLLTGGGWGLKAGTATAGASFTGGDGVKVIPIPDGLYLGGKTATASDSNLLAANIKSGVNLFGMAGTFTNGATAVAGDILSGKTAYANGTLVTGTAAAGASVNGANGQLVINIPNGLYSGSETVTASDSNLAAANIKSGVTIFGTAGTFTSDGDAVAGDLLSGKKAYVAGSLVTGTRPLAPGPVPKTGQTTSYAAGDDGDLEKGVAWPNPRFTDNSNGTVTDNLTGLIWLKNANCFGSINWANALADANTLATTACGLTDGSVAGDWRLPNVNELLSLIDRGRSAPALPSGHPFTGVQSSDYWSSTTTASNTGAWLVYLGGGLVYALGKAGTYYVWPVRGGL
ncbi:MAG: DUF1566 domain-containing protein [Candidatus Competibacteraceae bacterium]